MTLALIWLGGISLLELMVWTKPLWRLRKIFACLLIPPLSLVSGLVFGMHPVIWTGLILIFSIYRLINLLRLLENRLHPDYLFHATLKTSWWLIFIQLVIVSIAALSRPLSSPGEVELYAMSLVQLVIALAFFVTTRRQLRKTRPQAPATSGTSAKLPTLTVAIPARNETDDLEECLQSLVASDYPKLEVLVLDDCSQSRRTPEIIRGYAHAGVRFVSGKTPPQGWLAKNYAYQQLSVAANGELLLFCGVDTRFRTGSLREMVEIFLAKNKQMASFIPRNQRPPIWSIEALLVQPARYTWELALPRRFFKRPPVLSTCWLIQSEELKTIGGFEAVRQSIAPESHFAREVVRRSDGYSFLRGDGAIDLSSAKSLDEQRATAIRTRYPQLHRRPELVGLLNVLEIGLFVAPFGLLIGNLMVHSWLLALINAASCVLLMSFYASIVGLTYRRFLLRGLWALPMVAIYDLWLTNYSMWLYEFREVIWKDRDICLPLMRTIPHLPTIPDSGKTR